MAQIPHPKNVHDALSTTESLEDRVYTVVSYVIPAPDIMADTVMTDIKTYQTEIAELSGIFSGYASAMRETYKKAVKEPVDSNLDVGLIDSGLDEFQHIATLINQLSASLNSIALSFTSCIDTLRETNLF